MLIPIDLYNLVQTCKKYQKKISMSHIKKSAICEINRRLHITFGDELNGFKNAMREADATISGSFIIQCILGEHWGGSDVDVYVDKKMFMQFLMPEYYAAVYDQSRYKKIRFLDSDEESSTESSLDSELSEYENEHINMLQYMNDKNYCVEKIHKDYHGNPGTIVDYRINGTKIQFIGESLQKNFVISGYDFNICKNAYKFNDMFDGPTNLSIYRINEIFTKYTNFAPLYDLERNIKRYLKYSKRGFEFYSCNKENRVTNSNIWGHLNVDIIKLAPIEKRDFCKARMRNHEEYYFACYMNTVYSFARQFVKKMPLLHVCDKILTIDGIDLYPCHKDNFGAECLFNHIHPNVDHFHAKINRKSAIFFLDDFDIALS